MSRIHAAVITLIVGGAVAAGGVALSRSGADATRPGPAQTTVSDQTVAQRAAALDALGASLDTQEAAPPPTLAPKTITAQTQAPGTLSQRDDDRSEDRHDDDSGDEHGGGEDD